MWLALNQPPSLTWVPRSKFWTHSCVISNSLICDIEPTHMWYRTHSYVIEPTCMWCWTHSMWYQTHSYVISNPLECYIKPTHMLSQTHLYVILNPLSCDIEPTCMWYLTHSYVKSNPWYWFGRQTSGLTAALPPLPLICCPRNLKKVWDLSPVLKFISYMVPTPYFYRPVGTRWVI